MPQNINQPANRISLTNISLVRLKKGKKRFEIACYKNKLLEYRSGLETDLDNVLQVPTIFLSVSKGQTAPKEDLQKAFGKGVSNDDMIVEILKKGEVQVGANERKELLDRIEQQVVEMVSERVVDPETKRVYTTGIIRKALDLLAKQSGQLQQGLDAPKQLDKEDEGAAADEEQAGYMGLGKLDINDEEGNKKSHQKNQGKKSNKKSKANKGGARKDSPDDSDRDTATNDHPKPSHSQPNSQDQTDGQHRADPNEKHLPTWTGVSTSKPPKALALEAIKALIYHQPIPIQRARMRLHITIPASIAKQTIRSSASSTSAPTSQQEQQQQQQQPTTVKAKILSFVEQVESQDTSPESGDWEVTGFVEPGSFKGLGEFVGAETRGRGRVEVLDMAVIHEDD